MPGQQIVCLKCAQQYGTSYECKRTMLPGKLGYKETHCNICRGSIMEEEKFCWMNDEFVAQAQEEEHAKADG